MKAPHTPCLLNAQIHVGSADWQSGPEGVVSFGSNIRMPVSVVDKLGHMLSVGYVGNLLDEHLNS
jgi:hypothetical protein